jgi:hypothetical protein
VYSTHVPDYVKKKMTGNGGEVEGEDEECPQLVPVTSPLNSRQSCPHTFTSVLRIRDVFFRIQGQKRTGSATKNLSIFNSRWLGKEGREDR